MIEEIKICIEVKEIVTGILTKNNQIDIERMKILIDIEFSIQVVFDKAFDDFYNYHESIKHLIIL
ncbi:unnamed protein product [Paramecium sonneborni]|uniref:Uncharacterized protein n=1 Tax=Paramecium sonneborni TaxID=65129 RepID=A0A8S1R5D0_9CILI|nr:unnamed protein product [Paramecium sonneborni]